MERDEEIAEIPTIPAVVGDSERDSGGLGDLGGVEELDEQIQSDEGIGDFVTGLEQDVRSPAALPQKSGGEAVIVSGGEKRTKPSFSVHDEYFHAMISYRRNTEGPRGNGFAKELYNQLLSGSAHAFEHGRWPHVFKEPKSTVPGQAKVFLDDECLKPGVEWDYAPEGKGGFVSGILSSLVFVPLLSWYDDDSGSVGHLVKLEEGKVDNVLLEYIVATELLKRGYGAIRGIVPIMVGGKNAGDKPSRFPMEKVDARLGKPHTASNERAVSLLKEIGALQPGEESAVLRKTVLEAVQTLLKYQGERVPKAAQAVLDCARDVVKDMINADVNAFRFSKPQASEVLEWLDRQHLRQYAKLFANHSLHSLAVISQLQPSQVSRLYTAGIQEAKKGADAAGEAAVKIGEEVELWQAVQTLQHDRLAKSLTHRLMTFSDKEAFSAAVFVTSNSVETGFSTAESQSIILVFGAQFLLFAVFGFVNASSDEAYKYVSSADDENPAPHDPPTLWHTRFWSPVFSIFLWLCLSASVWAARSRCSLLSRRVLVRGVACSSLLYLVHGIVDTAQCKHVTGHTQLGSASGCGRNSLISFVFLGVNALLSSSRWFWVCAALETAGYCAIYIFDAHFSAAYIALTAFNSMLSLLVLASVFMARLSATRKRTATAAQYATAWEAAVGQDRPSLEALARLTREEEAKLARARKRWLEQGGVAARVGQWLGQEVKSSVFTARGKLKQCSLRGEVKSDLDVLFKEALVLNDDFHAWVRAWCRVGTVEPGPVKNPKRAVQKVVRSYGREPARLTDLVRCTVVCETPDELRQCFQLILARSRVETGLRGAAGRAHRASQVLLHGSSVAPEPTNDDPDASQHDGASQHGGKAEEAAKEAATMQITSIKNRCDPDITAKKNAEADGGYRDLSLNVRVGWSMHLDCCEFVPVNQWEKTAGLVTHICEIQIMLRAIYDVKMRGGHSHYIEFRNNVVK